MAAANTQPEDTGGDLQHRIDLAIAERMDWVQHKFDTLEQQIQALQAALAEQPTQLSAGVDLVVGGEPQRIRFIQDYRGKLTNEQFYAEGAVAEFPASIAEQLINDKRAVAFNRKRRPADDDTDEA